MKIVVINPILYTNENSNIKKVDSIKDTMIYNLCLEIKKQGHQPVLIAASDYEPIKDKKYDFEVIFLKTFLKKIFRPNCIPFLMNLKKTLKELNPDLIISSEVFSINSLIVSCAFKNKTIIWHELAKHNNIMKRIPSIIWYNVIAKIFFKNTRIVARSKNAQEFIKKYCNNVSSEYIDHGVNINEFTYDKSKKKQFVVVSQLIKRKRIDGIIRSFSDFLENHLEYNLFIIGSGEEKNRLEKLIDKKYINNIKFLGQLNHNEIIPILSKSCALVINTEKDNSMLSIVESIATATPVITTSVPYNVDYIKKYKLGVISDNLSNNDYEKIIGDLDFYVNNCINYRNYLSNEYHVKQFIDEYNCLTLGDKNGK